MARTGARRAGAVALAVAIGTGALQQAAGPGGTPARAAAAAEVTPHITIDPTDKGGVVRHVGFDVKQYSSRTTALTEDLARRIFSTGAYDVLRVPIIPQPGNVTAAHGIPRATDGTTHLTPYIRFATWARTYASQAGVALTVFAGLKTKEDTTPNVPNDDCLSWGKSNESHAVCKAFSPYLHRDDRAGQPVDGVAYARYLRNYLVEWHNGGIDVGMLGVDNEGAGANAGGEPFGWYPNNDAQISPGKFDTIVTTLTNALAGSGTPVPQLVFNDAKVPDYRTICGNDSGAPGLSATGWNRIDYVAFHYGWDKRKVMLGGDGTGLPEQSIQQYIARLKACESSHDDNDGDNSDKHTWDTEFHFTPGDPSFTDVSLGVKALFDELNAGTNGLVWWGAPDTTADCTAIPTANEHRRLMALLSTALHNGIPLGTTRTSAVSKVSFQAIKNGRHLWLLVLADADATPQDLVIRADGHVISPSSHGYIARQWRMSGGNLGAQTCPTPLRGVQDQPWLVRIDDLPDSSVTIVRINNVFAS